MSSPSGELRKSGLRLSTLVPIIASHKLTVFFIIAFAFSWLVFLPMIVFHAGMEFTVLASFGPTVAALSTHRLATGSYRAFRIYTTWPRALSASAFGIALVVLTYVVLPGVTTANPHKLNWSILTSLTTTRRSSADRSAKSLVGEAMRSLGSKHGSDQFVLRCSWPSCGPGGTCRYSSFQAGPLRRSGSSSYFWSAYRSS